MKRTLHFVLMLLVVVSTIGTAEAKSTKKKKTKPVTVDQTSTEGQAQRATEFDRERKQSDSSGGDVVAKPKPIPFGPPVELQLKRADSRRFDLRSLPRTAPVQQERAELPEPNFHPVTIQGTVGTPEPSSPIGPVTPQAPAPPPINVFEGLDRFNWGAGSPPDTNGDVGPNNYIQTVNTSIGVYRKSDGFQQAAFTFNTFMSQGNFGNLCDTNNFGDPVVLYDTFEDRWMISDFAFLTDISGNVLAPSYQCFAVSMTGDPVAGGWNFYSIQISDALNDYPKFGVWPDGFYMSANMFSFGAGSSFKTARAWAFNKAQMYAGSPTVKVVTFDIAGGDFAVMPSNARLQTGTPPPGRPNLFISTEEFLNALTVYKFHVDWNNISLSTFTGPDAPLAATSWPNAAVGNAGQPGTAMLLDVLQIRAMVQNQYTNFGGTESLWIPHTVRRGAGVNGTAAPRWYQANVTGGTVAPNLVQGTTWDPDAANITNRFMPSLALDRAGNMAMGYSVSSAVNEPLSTTPATNCPTCVDTFPSIRYAGRLAADPINTFSQTEQIFFTGTASQTGINRWGDYSAMTLDPDGCTFWYTNEYANPADQTFNHRWLTKFGSIQAFPGCTPVGAGGTVSGTVTAAAGGAPISGVTVQLGSGRSTTTDGSGNYSFTGIPAGAYPSMTASKSGFVPGSASSIVVTDGGTTTQNFSLTAAPASACLTDTTQSDFQAGVFTSTLDINTSPGDVTLSNAPVIDQQNTAGTTTGTGFGTPNWTGQTFIPAVTGLLARVDFPLFCNGCTGTTPNLTLSVRATSAGLPTGADLASATIPGFSNGSATTNLSAIFGSPVTLTSGTQYALILRPAANPSVGGYFWIRASPSSYANGSRVLSADSGATWTADSTRDFNFTAYMQVGYNAAGNLVSSPKDSNPGGGLTPIWSTFSWNGSTPANTSLKFQLAGSNNVNGPFSFVGPDGTAGTFFTTSPVQLSPQFYNFRFLEYKAFLATTDPNVTPTLSDATACFNDVDCSTTTAAVTATPTTVCSSSAGNTASGPAGMTSYAWGIANGTITSATNTQSITYTAGASGSVTLSLTVTAPNGCIVSGSTPVTINPNPAVPTITISNVQTVTVTGGAGTFALTFSGQTTAPLAFNATAAAVQGALNGLSTIGGVGGSVAVTSSAGVYTVTFGGTLTGPQPQMSAVGAGGATAVVTSAPVCGDSLGNQASGPAGATTYAWSITNGTITSATNIQTITYTAGSSGTIILNLTVTNASSCSASSDPANIPINPAPPSPTITPGGPTTFCAGGSVLLTSSAASGNQWQLNGNPIGGATNTTYSATASGNYTVTVTDINVCTSAPSAGTTVTVNPTPASPTITPGGPTTFCAGGSVTLTSSSASGNQWQLNGNPIGGATNQAYVATASGSYTVVVTTLGCSSPASAATVVTVNPNPNATITAPPTMTSGTSAGASVASAGAGATYVWGVTNGSITGGAGTASITFTAGSAGTTTLNVTVTTAATCSDTKSANITVTPSPVTVTSVVPGAGRITGGSPVTINGTGFVSGATVTIGGSPATSVVFVSSIKLTAHTPAHAAGQVNVTVTNPDTTNGTLTNGFTYLTQQFDANGDGVIDPSDIFLLVDYLFDHGPAPKGPAGMLSGDANGDGSVDPADIFYIVNYLFTGGPVPYSTPVTPIVANSIEQPFNGALALGRPVVRNGRTYVPVILTMAQGSATPQAIALKLLFESAGGATIHRAGAAASAVTSFEISRPLDGELSYLVAFDQRAGGLSLGRNGATSGVIAEVEVATADALNIAFDPGVTILSDASGTRTATVANGTLQVNGIEGIHRPGTKRPEINQ